MNRIFSALLILAIFAGSSTAVAGKGQTSQPNQPASNVIEPLTQLDYKNPWNLVTDGRYAYVDSLIEPGAEVMILDILDPEHITEIASIPFERTGFTLLAVIEDKLYIGTEIGTGILIYDVSDPAHPVLSSTYRPVENMWPQQMVPAGNLAYLVDYTLGLAILDISDPANPILLGNNSEEIIWSMAIEGQYAYALTMGKLITYDISNPAQPTLIGRYENASRWGEMIAVHGDRAYVSGSLRDAEYQITGYFTDLLDISNPAQVERIKELPQIPGPVKDLSIYNEQLYALLPDGLGIYSLTDPEDPQLSGKYAAFWGMHFDLQGNKAVLLDNVTGLHIVDITDAANPSQIGFYGWPQEADFLVASGTILYSTKNYYGYFPEYGNKFVLRVTDVTDPFNAVVSGYMIFNGHTDGKPFVDGSTVYIPYDWGVQIVDASDSGNLQLLGRLGPNQATAVEVLENKAYSMQVGTGNFTISDVSNPAAPVQLSETQLGIVNFQRQHLSIIRQGSQIFAYLATGGDDTLVILDVTDPLNPVEVRREMYLDASYSGIDTESRGSQTIAYFSGWDFDYPKPGVFAMDVSDPANPIDLSSFPDDKLINPSILEAKNGMVYFFPEGWAPALTILDTSDPTHPVEIGKTLPPNEWILDASVEGKTIFTTGGGSITVFELTSDLSGFVTDHNHKPFSGVTLNLNNGANTLTGEDGSYLFSDLDFGSYAVTPTLGTFAFYPPYREVSLPTDWNGQNFVILPPPTSAILSPGITTTLTYTDVQGLPTSFIFPSGLVSSTATAHITPTLASGFFGRDFAGHAFQVGIDTEGPDSPDELFTQPVSVTIQYSLDDTAVITDTTALTLYRYNGSSWEAGEASCPLPDEALTQEPGIFQGRLCQEGLYALFGPVYGIAIPMISSGGADEACEPPGCPPMSTNRQE